MNVPSEEELRELWEKGGCDAIMRHAKAAADRDAERTLIEAYYRAATETMTEEELKLYFGRKDGTIWKPEDAS